MRNPPGFSAESSLYRGRGGYQMTAAPGSSTGGWNVFAQAIRRIPGGGGLSYNCTPDHKACACSGAADCMSCTRDTRACGDPAKDCICNPKTNACACS
jgi:hypothetical protein